MRIGVFVVAYNARTTIRSVLARIRPETWKRITEVFIFDDASQDSTAREASDAIESLPYRDRIRLFRNAVNLGYGGNQMRGYLYAARQKLDVVVLLHGDGQYAPECLDELIDPIVNGEAEAVLGSRMLIKGAARAGGMPIYKYLGNRALTAFQNRLLGLHFSEYHSGYRAYHVPSLSRLPFTRNSTDFHFDNEIILQFLEAGLRVKEVPIPTYYGGEICRVNGMRYAWNVVKNTIKYRLHKAGLSCFDQFDMRTGSKYTYKGNRYSSHERIVRMVGDAERAKGLRVLDLGCGSCFLAAKLSAMGCHVTGYDVYDDPHGEGRYSAPDVRANEQSDDLRIPEAARTCPAVKPPAAAYCGACEEFHVCDIEKVASFGPDGSFDCVILADVLEHLRDPEQLLMRVIPCLKPNGRLIASTGNVANFYIRLMLLFGRFTYTERGILDRTHTRLFTRRSFRRLIEDSSFSITQERACPIPFELVIAGWPRLAGALSGVNMLLAKIWSSLFAYQFVLEARVNRDSPSQLLKRSEILKANETWSGSS